MGNIKTTKVDTILYNFCRTNNYANADFITVLKSDIEKFIFSKGFKFRFANIDDIEKLSNFQREIFYPHTLTLENQYELFRIIKFGYIFLIESQNELLGFYSTIHYSGPEKIGYGIRVGVSPTIAGNNFAALLAKYATIIAYENNCKYFTALMSPTNFRSASNVLNHVGYYCEKFHKNLPSFGTRFEITLPLNIETLNNAEIDLKKITNFIKETTLDKDYLLFQPSELDRMEITYKETDFKIIAFLKKGLIDSSEYFFAIRPFID